MPWHHTMSGVHLCILVTEVLIKCIVGVPSTTSLYTEDVPLRVLKKAGFPSSLVSFTQMVIQFFLRFPRSTPPPLAASQISCSIMCRWRILNHYKLLVCCRKKCADQNLNSPVWTMYILNIITLFHVLVPWSNVSPWIRACWEAVFKWRDPRISVEVVTCREEVARIFLP